MVSTPHDNELRIATDAILRPWRPDDAADLWDLTKRHRDHFGRWLGWPDRVRRVNDVADFIACTGAAIDAGTGYDLTLVVAGKIAGGMGLCEIDRASRRSTMGYWLSPEHQGKGLMTLAGRSLLAYAVARLELERIEIWTMAGNVRSRRLAERLGFRMEGVLRQRELHRGCLHDRVVYGLVREDEQGDHTAQIGRESGRRRLP